MTSPSVHKLALAAFAIAIATAHLPATTRERAHPTAENSLHLDVPINSNATTRNVKPRHIAPPSEAGSAGHAAARTTELHRAEFAHLPLKDAIATVRGDGRRAVAVFEDPNCGYCKKQLHEFSKIDNVTIYTFLVSIVSPDSTIKAKAVWCAADRSKTWVEFMEMNKPLPANTDCEAPLERNLALSRRLGLTGTPALLFPSDSKNRGYLPADQIELKLAGK